MLNPHISRILPRSSHIVKHIRQKSSKPINKIHQNNKEEKLLFGTVESLKNKHKKIKESKTVESKAPSSELFWLINWNANKVKILKKNNGQFTQVSKEDLLKEIYNEEPVVADCYFQTKEKPAKKKSRKNTLKINLTNVEEVSSSETIKKKRKKKKEMKIDEMVPIESESKIKAAPVVKGETIKVADIFVKHMTNFPLHNNQFEKTPFTEEQNQKFSKLPSVSRILNETMSESARAALVRWKTKMILEMGEEGFQNYSQGLLQKGAQMHYCIKLYLEGKKEEMQMNDNIAGCWSSLEHILPEITDVRVLEGEVIHPKLLYKGIVDCVASYNGTPCVIEWKKSDKLKPEISATYDAPLQLCAYLGALSFDTRYSGDMNFDNGLVVVAYSDGTPAQVFPLSLEQCLRYWNLWLQRLQTYWTSHNSEQSIN